MAHSLASPLRHCTRPSLLSSFITPIPTPQTLRFFSTSTLPLALRPSAPPIETDPIEDDESDANRSRNARKRDARRAVRWGMDIADFPTPTIERIVKAASLQREVLEALMLVKRLGHDVREGKRRQFNYIGRLLRSAEPELMDALIQASKDGDSERLLALSVQETSPVEEPEEEEIDDDEACEKYMGTATRWFNGLIDKDPSVTNEVYSIYNVEFDRQELRKLVRQVQSVQEVLSAEKSGEERLKFTRGKKPLIRFLLWLAKESSE